MTTLKSLGFLAPVSALLLAWTPSSVAQDDFSVDDWSDAYEASLKSKKDGEALAALQILLEEYGSLDEKAQKAAAKAVAKGLTRKRDEEDHLLYTEIVNALGAMKGAGELPLAKALKHKHVDKRPTVLAAALPALGKHANPKHIKTLKGYLNHPKAVVVAGAVRGMGEYTKEKERVRKELVGELIKRYSAIYALSIQTGSRGREAGQPLNRADKETLQITQPAFDSSLAALTGAKGIKGSDAWYSWYNEHRKERWDKDDKGR